MKAFALISRCLFVVLTGCLTYSYLSWSWGVVLLLFWSLLFITFIPKIELDRESIGSISLFLYFHFALILGPTLAEVFLDQRVSTEVERNIIFLGFISEILLILLYKLLSKKSEIRSSLARFAQGLYFPKKTCHVHSFSLLILFFSLIYLLSFVSYYLGVSPMGVPAPELPFKLEPFLNISRTVVVPVIFIFVYRKYQRALPSFIPILVVLYLLWVFFEIYAKGSRGFLLTAFLPLVLYLLAFSKVKLKKLVAFAFLGVVLFSLNYSVGQYLRTKFVGGDHEGDHSFTSRLSEVPSFLVFRVLPEAWLFEKLKHHTPRGTEFSNFDLYEEFGGAVLFHTYELDKTPEGTTHSSGMTGLADGFLLFGWKGAYLTAGFFIIYFLLIDFFLRSFPDVKVLFVVYGIELLIFKDGIWSFFLYRNVLTVLAMPICSLIFAYLLRHIKFHQEKRLENLG